MFVVSGFVHPRRRVKPNWNRELKFSLGKQLQALVDQLAVGPLPVGFPAVVFDDQAGIGPDVELLMVEEFRTTPDSAKGNFNPESPSFARTAKLNQPGWTMGAARHGNLPNTRSHLDWV
jgi:hypothetical protein